MASKKTSKPTPTEKIVNIDAVVEAKKTSGTDFQAYMRDLIQNAGK